MAGWADITEAAAKNVLAGQEAKRATNRPFGTFIPSRLRGNGESARDYLLEEYAVCLANDPTPDPEHGGVCSINVGGGRNGQMARRCNACGWITDRRGIIKHLGSSEHLLAVERQRAQLAWEAGREEQSRRTIHWAHLAVSQSILDC